MTGASGPGAPGLQLVVHGARGSMSAAGPHLVETGGNTTSYSVRLDPDTMLIFDCGTGLRRLQGTLDEEGPIEYHVFLTHYHWDHIQGIPFFTPLHTPGVKFTVYGRAWGGLGPADLLDGAIRPPWFPVSFSDSPASLDFVTIDTDPVRVGPVEIIPAVLHHPQGVSAYRLQRGDRSIVIATDHEAGDAEADATLDRLAAGADILLHDAQYTPEEYERLYRGWGHSTWRHATAAARRAGAGRLVLVSHDPGRDDRDIDRIEADARAVFPATVAAREGMTLPL